MRLVVIVTWVVASAAALGGGTADETNDAGTKPPEEEALFRLGVDEPRLYGLLGLEAGSPSVVVAYIARLGLANRLRALAASWLYAEEVGMELKVFWAPSSGCNATLNDLFDVEKLPFGRYTGSPALLANIISSTVHINASKHVADVYTESGLSVVVRRSNGIRLERLDYAPHVAVVLEPRGQFALEDVPCAEYFFRKARFYKEVLAAAAADVRKKFDTLMTHALGKKLVVGLHVRRYEAEFDWPTVPPQRFLNKETSNNGSDNNADQTITQAATTPSLSGEAQTWDMESPVAAHFAVAEAVLARYPRAVLFVCSNDETVKTDAVTKFGARRVVALNNAPYGGRSDVEGVKAALLDFLVLAEAALILHTFGSSFGEEAATVHLAPTVRIRSDGHLLGTDLTKAHCNNPLFENAARTPTDQVCYADSTATAEICAEPIRRRRCDDFIQAWAVPDVYC